MNLLLHRPDWTPQEAAQRQGSDYEEVDTHNLGKAADFFFFLFMSCSSYFFLFTLSCHCVGLTEPHKRQHSGKALTMNK